MDVAAQKALRESGQPRLKEGRHFKNLQHIGGPRNKRIVGYWGGGQRVKPRYSLGIEWFTKVTDAVVKYASEED